MGQRGAQLGWWLLALLLLAALAFAALHLVPIHVQDGFESPRLNPLLWSTRRLVAGSLRSEAEIVRSGRRALAITVHDGDRYEAASRSGAATERDELMESWWLYSRSGRSYVYSFSLYLPADFPQTSQRLVLAQWRQLCEARRCNPDRPILAVRYEEGRLQVSRQDEHGKVILYQGVADVRGRWLDFRFVIRFSHGADGRIQASLNRQPILSYRGPTLFQPAPGYPAHGLIYFKTGLYRDFLQQPPWTMYVDDFRKDQCSLPDCR